MKLHVIVDKNDNVIGSSQAGNVKTSEGVEIKLGITPGPEQSLHEIEVDDNVLKGTTEEIHQKIQKILNSR